MTFDRRSFIGLGSLFVCGTVFGTPLRSASTSAGEAVLAYVRSYGGDFRIVEGADGRGELHLVVELRDVNHWPEAMARAPFPGMRADGNTLAFAHNSVDVTIENLTPEVFSARLASLG